jgi:hypothetical protein
MLYYILGAVIILCAAAVAYIYYTKEEELFLNTEEVTISGKRALRHYCTDYEIWEIFNFISPEEALKCIDTAEHLAKTTHLKNKPPNMIARLTKDDYEFIETLGKVISKLTNTFIRHKDSFGIYKYIPGTNIEGHYDGCSRKKDKVCAEVEVSNIIFLNNDYTGGSLYFGSLDLMIRPEVGKLVMFKNYDKEGKIVPYSGFKSTKVLNGMQYLLR